MLTVIVGGVAFSGMFAFGQKLYRPLYIRGLHLLIGFILTILILMTRDWKQAIVFFGAVIVGYMVIAAFIKPWDAFGE